MSTAYPSAVISGLMEEVNAYLPTLFKGVQSLKTNPQQTELIREIHRLVHTIKGAASMVGISGLSRIAAEMEDALDEMIDGRLIFDEAVFEAFHATIKRFEIYCEKLLSDGVNSRQLLRETLQAMRKVRGLNTDENNARLKTLLESTPLREGGEPEEADNNEDEDGLADLSPPPEAMELENEEEPVKPQKAPQTALSPELLATFYDEAEEHLDNLGHALNGLEAQIDAPMDISPSHQEQIREIRRYVHTLKGAAAVIGFQDCSKWAHHMEDLLDWIYAETQTITPKMIAVLSESADILVDSVNDPSVTHSPRANQLKKELFDIKGPPSAEPQAAGEVSEKEPGARDEDETEDDLETYSSAPEIDAQKTAGLFRGQGKTLRIETPRVDELVNLMGELIITASGFDQRMELFKEALYELELARERLRGIARDMEIGYEVKALENLGTFGLEPDSDEISDSPSGFEDFDALELDRYSQLNLIIRTLNEATIDVGAIYSQLTTAHSDFEGNINRQRVLLSELQDKTMRMRMTPMAIITNRLRRTVREIAFELNKSVRLIIQGEEIELDRQIWEKMIDPMMHMLRNAVDHGIESAEIRKAEGKPETATINLIASREGNQVVIRVRDDGAGLNYSEIRKVAREKKLADNIEQMGDEELNRFIFQPGFSTRHEISTISGRGVGMDVVRENIQNLKGVVRVSSEKGRGTEFIIRIPLTLAAVRALLFSVQGRTLALPLSDISEIMRIKPSNILTDPQHAVRIGDEVLPYYELAEVLKVQEHDQGIVTPENDPLILVVNSVGRRNAMVIDHLIGQREIVIKSTGSHLRYVKGVSGVTIMGDGSVVPILNMDALLGEEPVKTDVIGADIQTGPAKSLEILVVDDSVSIRQVVSRLIEDQGWRAQTAKDGIDALEKLREIHPDLIILDIEMPRMNGYEFINALKTQPRYGDIPIVMLTSRTAAKHRDKAAALGVKGFIVKPYNDDEFINVINALTQ